MSNRTLLGLVALFLFTSPVVAKADLTGDVAKGESVFKKCQACHVVKDDTGTTLAGRSGRTGPNLFGIDGKVQMSVAGYKYSKDASAWAESGTVWDEAMGWCVSSTECPYDFDGSGYVTVADLLIFLIAFNQPCPN